MVRLVRGALSTHTSPLSTQSGRSACTNVLHLTIVHRRELTGGEIAGVVRAERAQADSTVRAVHTYQSCLVNRLRHDKYARLRLHRLSPRLLLKSDLNQRSRSPAEWRCAYDLLP
jgi:hypothetical protein